MRSAGQEGDVLKLVHPGGYVELHTKPITASEVMKRNPRHCVTRPDVFKFPWIVVRPDSVLKLGTVFFIVPNHTIHRLLRAAGARRQHSLLRNHLKPQSRVGDEHSKEQSIVEQWLELPPEVQRSSYESWADATPKHRNRGRVKQQSTVIPKRADNDRSSSEPLLIKSSGDMAGKKPIRGLNSKPQTRFDCFLRTPLLSSVSPKRCNEETPKNQIRDQRLRKHSPDNPWHDMSKQPKEQLSNDSLVRVKPSTAKTLDVKNGKSTVDLVLPPKQELGLLKLKSCLRKPENKDRSRRRGRKVKFLLPSEDEKFVEDVKYMTLSV